MNSSETDSAEVLRSYAQALSEKQSVTCNARRLPFPKDLIKSAITYYLRREHDDQVVEHLEFAYQLLADFQQLSEDERQSVEVMESLQDTSDMSDEEYHELASRVTDTGVVYHSLRCRISEESKQLQTELKSLRTQ